MAASVIASNLAKKVGNTSTAGSNGTSSDGEGRENECSDGTPPTVRGRVGPI